MKQIIVIVGPTGVGKTKMGIALAKEYNGEIISGDSMQIYRGMNIGTAKASVAQREGIFHHLIDIKDPQESYSVMEFQKGVRSCIDTIWKQHKVPIIVGGTGLYIKAALYDYSFEEMSQSNHTFHTHDNAQLYEYLQQIDPESAQTLHPNNRQRVLRAIEIYEATGKKKSDIIANQQHTCLYDVIFIGLTQDRPILYRTINERVESMLLAGLEEEVRQLVKQGCNEDMQSMKAIGYKEWFAYFRGMQTKEQTKELIQNHSRKYAKRQYTWFRNQLPVRWYTISEETFCTTKQHIIDAIEKKDNL